MMLKRNRFTNKQQKLYCDIKNLCIGGCNTHFYIDTGYLKDQMVLFLVRHSLLASIYTVVLSTFDVLTLEEFA